MRIKGDYVTNSSSTCYVVCLPNNKEWILKNLQESDWDEEAGYPGGAEAEVLITKLLNGELIWNEDNQKWYDPIMDFCHENNFIFAEFEVESDRGQMVNITSDNVNKMAGIVGIDWIKEVTTARKKEENK